MTVLASPELFGHELKLYNLLLFLPLVQKPYFKINSPRGLSRVLERVFDLENS